MSSNVSELLQKCLEAYDAGFSPEDCLSAFPNDRAALEPLLRQALSLRMAFANAPAEAFLERTRERLLFAAGREVTQAFASEPRAEFVDRARQRLVQAAGASAQEALRSVPPPRLPFWWNARRRLLEAAATPRQRHSFHPPTLALRTGLSAAVVALVIAIAGMAYITALRQPTSVNAELDALEQQLNDVEHKAAVGEYVSPSVLADLSRRTSELALKLEDQQATAAEKLPALVQRQKEVLNLATPLGSKPPELVQAQQQLNQAERTLAQRNDITSPQPSTNNSAAPVVPPAPTAAPALSLQSLQPGQVLVAPLPSDTTYGLSWNEVRTTNVRFVIPTGWRVTNVTPVSANIAALNGPYVGLDGGGSPVAINVTNGEISAIINNQPVSLRTANGVIIPVEDLFAKAGSNSVDYRHLLESFTITGIVQPSTTQPVVPPAGPINPAGAPTATPVATNPAVPPTPTKTATPQPTPANKTTPSPVARP